MSEINAEGNKLVQRLSGLFGSYRAEWSGDDLFRHFTEPSYFNALKEFRPCVLQGGRGSGKTTALRGLSYLGQYRFLKNDICRFDAAVKYIGLYHRIDTNHVRTFMGGDIPEELWGKLFGHYFNMIIVMDVVGFLKWHKCERPEDGVLPADDLDRIFHMFGLEGGEQCRDYSEFYSRLEDALYDFQNLVNNIAYHKNRLGNLSTIGEPIDLLMSKVRGLRQFQDKYFFLLLDEYENFADYQQVIVNTMIKHSVENFTFKIGVRKLGWRKKHTLNVSEVLNDPADYALLDIDESFGAGKSFHAFAKNVCQKRFQMLLGEDTAFDIENALDDLTMEEEAEKLGADKTEVYKNIAKLPRELRQVIKELPVLYKFTMAQWAAMHGEPLEQEVRAFIQDRNMWNGRYDNYKYHMLFKIKTGRGSGQHQKFYCGFDTFTKLASNNIRFLMELVYKTFESHLLAGKTLTQPVSAEMQTDVARGIGEKNLAQLEGLCREGSRIVRMLFGMGRVFEMLAKAKSPGAAEVNQFVVEGIDRDPDLTDLVNVAVRDLALERMPSNKLTGFEARAYEYNIHPIFAPYFTFSYRRKRKMNIAAADLKSLCENPDRHVKGILERYFPKMVSECDKAQLTFSL